jgi:hypothetical protein
MVFNFYVWKKIPGGTNYTIAYNNVYYFSSETRLAEKPIRHKTKMVYTERVDYFSKVFCLFT